MFFVRLEPLIWRGTFADLRLYSSVFLEIEFGEVQEVVTSWGAQPWSIDLLQDSLFKPIQLCPGSTISWNNYPYIKP